MKIARKLVRKLVRKFARKFARKFGHENFATKRFGKFSPQKIHPNLLLCSGTLLGNERRRPKSEMLGFSQPGCALRRFGTTMSAHASKPSNFLCVSLWCQGCFRNLFVKVYRWMGKTEVIMVAFAEDNASNRPREILIRKNLQGPLWEIGSAKMPRTPNLSKICPDCCSGFQSGGPKFAKSLSKIMKPTISGQIFRISRNF